MELSDFTISFKRDALFGFWSWTATAGDLELSGPLFGVCAAKENAEKDALRRLRLYCDRYEVSGADLAGRALP